MTQRTYAARHSIPPGIRDFGNIGIDVRMGGGLASTMSESSSSFQPASVRSCISQTRDGVSAQLRRLNDLLAALALEAEGDEHLSKEMELIRAQIARLTAVFGL